MSWLRSTEECFLKHPIAQLLPVQSKGLERHRLGTPALSGSLRQQKLAPFGAPMTKKLEVHLLHCESLHEALGRLAAVEKVTRSLKVTDAFS